MSEEIARQIRELLATGDNMDVYIDASEVFCSSGIMTDLLTEAECKMCYAEYGNDWDWEEAELLLGTPQALRLIGKLSDITGIVNAEDICNLVDTCIE